jgi:hypothetical protein
MNKKQALAAMDAHMVPVAAKRLSWFQKRQRFMLCMYPALKRAPPEERADLLAEARRYALKQWTAYAAIGLVVVVAIYLLREQIFGTASDVPSSTMLPLFVLAVVPGATLYIHISGYLRLLIGSKHEQDHDTTSHAT